MALLLLFLGTVLIGLTWKQAWRKAIDEEKNAAYFQSIMSLSERVSALETRVSNFGSLQKETAAAEQESLDELLDYKFELVLRAVAGLEDKIEAFDIRPEKQKNESKHFSAYVQEAGNEAAFKEIRDAYLSGKSVTEIAEQWGKGKGEIELILNLQK